MRGVAAERPAKRSMAGASCGLNKLASEEKRFFRAQLREARAQALRDSESFDAITLVIERLGRLMTANGNGLGSLRAALGGLASRSPLAERLPKRYPTYHLSFAALFELVREGRNSAVHEGAAARNLTAHAVELALVLEDGLMPFQPVVAEVMVRAPVIAEPWHPVSFVRQQLLANSFSYLPIMLARESEKRWQLISDAAVAAYLAGATSGGDRSRRLQARVHEAVGKGWLRLETPICVPANSRVSEVVARQSPIPTLVIGDSPGELIGIVTAFDLL